MAPAHAVDRYYSYQISGNFANNTGPDQKGKFVGVAQWDTTLNGGIGGWYDWNFDFLSSTGSVLQTIKNSDSGAGCFASPVARGGAASGPYAESAPGGSVCDGTNGNLPAQSFLNIFNNVPHAWSQGGNNLNAQYTYFRLKFQANANGGTTVDPTNLVAVPANAQSVGGLGWAAMTDDTVAGACSGNNSFPTATQSTNNRPYAGNTQNYQGVSGVTNVSVTTIPGGNGAAPLEPVDPAPLVANEPDVPGPLPILGASAALVPPRLLDPRWLQAAIQALVSNAMFPVIGTCLLVLAGFVDPEDPPRALLAQPVPALGLDRGSGLPADHSPAGLHHPAPPSGTCAPAAPWLTSARCW
jgi:hypothetical protein